MKNLFIPYELALIAKEKGFNEPCLARYDIDKTISQTNIESNSNGFNEQVTNDNLLVMVASPLYQQIIDWFREKHNIHFEIRITYTAKYSTYSFCLMRMKGDLYLETPCKGGKYYEALNKAIEEAFKLI